LSVEERRRRAEKKAAKVTLHVSNAALHALRPNTAAVTTTRLLHSAVPVLSARDISLTVPELSTSQV
jgi:hypothetical protein